MEGAPQPQALHVNLAGQAKLHLLAYCTGAHKCHTKAVMHSTLDGFDGVQFLQNSGQAEAGAAAAIQLCLTLPEAACEWCRHISRLMPAQTKPAETGLTMSIFRC